MTARSKARKRALDILFESDLRDADPLTTLAAWERRDDPPVAEHAVRLVRLVAEHTDLVDATVAERLVGWDFHRLAPVDRALLRLATAELLWVDDVPDAVSIDEAVELAKSLSTDDAPAFVNAVLARIAADKPQPSAQPEEPAAAEEPAQPAGTARRASESSTPQAISRSVNSPGVSS